MNYRLIHADVLDGLNQIEDESVQCVMTSPPYWGLRDYGTARWEGGSSECNHVERYAADIGASNGLGKIAGYRDKLPVDNAAFKGRARQFAAKCGKCGAVRVDAQLGLEPTPDEYVARMVEVFREVRRVLRSDGTCFVNLGDSYFGGGRGGGGSYDAERRGWRGLPCGTSDIERGGWIDRDCPSFRLCDACAGDLLSRTSHTDLRHDVKPPALPIESTLAHKESPIGRPASSDYARQENQPYAATPDFSRTSDHGDGLPHAEHGTTTAESSRPLPADCRQSDTPSPSPSSLATSSADAPASARMLDGASETTHCTEDNASPFGERWTRIQGKDVSCSRCEPSRDFTTASLKPKDLVGIPWMLAFALRADGWYLRSDIIWSKPNPMPESVTDRPTKAHEYLFLLTKSRTYFYDADAIKEANTGRASGNIAGFQTHNKAALAVMSGGAGCDDGTLVYEGRNKRSVWTIATEPFPEAHFATFPTKLVEPCILAGSRVGDTILDPFNGSGTTGVVALSHQRDYVGIELNADYVAMSRRRLESVAPMFAHELVGLTPNPKENQQA